MFFLKTLVSIRALWRQGPGPKDPKSDQGKAGECMHKFASLLKRKEACKEIRM